MHSQLALYPKFDRFVTDGFKKTSNVRSQVPKTIFLVFSDRVTVETIAGSLTISSVSREECERQQYPNTSSQAYGQLVVAFEERVQFI